MRLPLFFTGKFYGFFMKIREKYIFSGLEICQNKKIRV